MCQSVQEHIVVSDVSANKQLSFPLSCVLLMINDNTSLPSSILPILISITHS